MLEWLNTHEMTAQVIRSAILVFMIALGRWIILQRLRQADAISNDMRRRWAAQVRLVSLLLLLLALFFIWGTELRTFALSVVAIAAAIVIATKELIMCVSGSVLRASGRSFQIGDRIEIGAFRGDVVDQTLLTTTILEVGPGTSIHQHTGRTIVIPNSVLLTTPVLNETFSDEFVLHAFNVPIAPDEDWHEAEKALLDAARAECASFLADAERHMDRLVRREGLEPLSVEPRVTLRLDNPAHVVMLARIAVPARRKGRIEQAIL
ncbi:MAG: mechanosensitive ion channel family protein, partial [Phycisphaerales bacterium]|nr:mechanosensitive ion channel family protein [Phycisphaerales bacterium]